jgi:hypothetical protein
MRLKTKTKMWMKTVTMRVDATIDALVGVLLHPIALVSLGVLVGWVFPPLPSDQDPQPLEGPMCYGASNVGRTVSVPLAPEPPPLPRLWETDDPGYHEQMEAVNDFLWNECPRPHLMAGLIHVESFGNPTVVSYAGARGLTQLMPRTAEYMAGLLDVAYYDGVEFVPAWNVRVGWAYLEYLLRYFDGNEVHALTAYNRGIGNTRFILREYGELPQHVVDFYAAKVLRQAARRQRGFR